MEVRGKGLSDRSGTESRVGGGGTGGGVVGGVIMVMVISFY